MSNSKQKYTCIRKRYLAESLSYLGFKYFRFCADEGYILYSFENSEKFQEALNEMLKLKKRFTYA